MNTASPPRPAALSLLLASLLAGCAATGGAGSHSHGTGTGGSSSQPSTTDMQAMCDMHRQRMAGRTPQERQAMMEEHMRSMTPEMRSRMEAMMRDCR